jgi:hypothetical protein
MLRRVSISRLLKILGSIIEFSRAGNEDGIEEEVDSLACGKHSSWRLTSAAKKAVNDPG